MNDDFIQWVNTKLSEYNWSIRELSRQTGIDASNLSKILSGKREPGLNFYLSLSKAFEEQPERIFRLAGILPELDREEITFQELLEIANRLTPDQRQTIVDFAEFLAKKHRNEASEKS